MTRRHDMPSPLCAARLCVRFGPGLVLLALCAGASAVAAESPPPVRSGKGETPEPLPRLRLVEPPLPAAERPETSPPAPAGEAAGTMKGAARPETAGAPARTAGTREAAGAERQTVPLPAPERAGRERADGPGVAAGPPPSPDAREPGEGGGSAPYDEVLELPELTVTAPRRAPDDPVDPARTVASVTVVEVAGQEARSLAETLEGVPGLRVRQQGGPGSRTTLSIRGSTSQQVAIYLDGVLLNSAQGGGVDLSSIPVEQVETVEVFRGSAPARFGEAGLGGVVHIRTRRDAASNLAGTVTASLGSYDYRKGAFYASRSGKKADLVLSGSLLEAENDFEFINDQGTRWNPDDDAPARRINNDERQRDLLAKLRFRLGDAFTLDLRDSLLDRERGLPGQGHRQAERVRLATVRNAAEATLRAADLWREGTSLSASLYHNVDLTDYRDPEGEIGLGRQDNRYRTSQLGARLRATLPLHERAELFLQAETRREAYVPTQRLNTARPPRPSRRESLFASGELRLELLPERLTLVPAARWQRHESELYDDRLYGADPKFSHGTYRHADGQLGAILRLADGFVLKANAGTYTRAPTLYEMFGDRGFRIGNPELRPEEGENLDLGLRLERNDPLAGVDRLLLEATVFRRDVTDLIRTVYDARGVGRSVNLDRAVFRGLEGVFGLQVGGHLRLEQTLTLQETRVSSPYRYEDGNVVPGHPAQAWSTRVELFGEPLEGLRATLFGEWRGDSGGFYDTANLIPRYEDFVMNAGVEARYGRFRATLEVKNVTDWNREGTIDDGVIHYGREETVGYPLPGRHFALHLACEF